MASRHRTKKQSHQHGLGPSDHTRAKAHSSWGGSFYLIIDLALVLFGRNNEKVAVSDQLQPKKKRPTSPSSEHSTIIKHQPALSSTCSSSDGLLFRSDLKFQFHPSCKQALIDAFIATTLQSRSKQQHKQLEASSTSLNKSWSTLKHAQLSFSHQ